MRENINVCLMNDSFPPVIDGVSNAVLNYARVIQNRFGNAIVVTPQHPEAEDDYPFQVLRYPSIKAPKLQDYRVGAPFSVSVFHSLVTSELDLIHLHCPFTSAIHARMVRNTVKVPLIFTYHTKYDIDIKEVIASKGVQKSAISIILNNIEACDEVWAVSRGAGENLRSLGYEGEYIVMRNGVDLPKGRVDEKAVEKLRASLQITPDTPTYLFVGRLMWYKGIDIILEGLKKASDQGLKYKMIFIGSGADGADIKKRAKELNIYENCIFVGAVRDREKLRAYYSLADMLLFPSTFDTNGLVVAEAASCALPSVLVRDSAAAEGVKDLWNGLLIDENRDSMAALLLRVCQNKGLLRQIGERAMDEIYVSWDESISKAVERYNVVLERFDRGLV